MGHFTVKILICLSLLGAALHGAVAVTHSLKYFYTAPSGVPNFPEFVANGFVDDVQIDHYDSDTEKEEVKQDWMKNITADDRLYLNIDTGAYKDDQEVLKDIIETTKPLFNHTGDVHVYQSVYGCEWDDETGEVKGVWQFGYDGEDFIVFDRHTKTWVTPKPQAVIIKHRLDNNNAYAEYWKEYLTQGCPEGLKKFVDYGRSSLLRTVLPSVSLLQKTPSSPVSCHATGFYPDRAELFWRKDGEEILERSGEILPNQDGTFQMRVDLNLSSVRPEDWRRYHCVFQLAGVKKNTRVTRLDKDKIRSNEEKPFDSIAIIITAVVAQILCLIAVLGFIVYKKQKAECTSCTDIPETKKLNPPPTEPPTDSSA